MRKALYAGMFDPLTKGHEWTIMQAADLFDEVAVAVAINSEKKPLFSTEERISMLKDVIMERRWKNVSVVTIGKEYLVDYAQSIGARFLIRGIRSAADYAYERTMCHVNARWKPGIQTVFLMAPPNLEEVSSSFVKSLIGFKGWEGKVAELVSEPVLRRLQFVVK